MSTLRNVSSTRRRSSAAAGLQRKSRAKTSFIRIMNPEGGGTPSTIAASRGQPQVLNQLAGIGRQVGQAADADREIALRPLVREGDDGNGRALEGAARRGLGHDAEADVALDHAAHRV